MSTLLGILTKGSTFGTEANNTMLDSLREEQDTPTTYLLSFAGKKLQANKVDAASADNRTLYTQGNVTILAPRSLPRTLDSFLTNYFALYEDAEFLEAPEEDEDDLGFEIVDAPKISEAQAADEISDVSFRTLLEISTAIQSEKPTDAIPRVSFEVSPDESDVLAALSSITCDTEDNLAEVLEDIKYCVSHKRGIREGNPTGITIITGSVIHYSDQRKAEHTLHNGLIREVVVKDGAGKTIQTIQFDRASISNITKKLIQEYSKKKDASTIERLGKAKEVITNLLKKAEPGKMQEILRSLLVAIGKTGL